MGKGARLKLPEDERARRKKAARAKESAKNKSVHPRLVQELLDMAHSPCEPILVGVAENRALFNLGDGSRWRRTSRAGAV